jgi:predicted O-methyltransferase YrrM
MKNLIFICVFNNQEYIKLLYLLLESIFIFGNLNENTDILIYTSTPFMNIIKQSHLFNNHIIFHTNDNYNSVDLACKSRLDLFDIPVVENYNKILYLDSDILIQNDINPIFDIIDDNKIYALQDGFIDNPDNLWGNFLFGNEVQDYEDKTAFCTGVMLFNNCSDIKELFTVIKQDFIARVELNTFHDQPYIVYNAFKYNLFNNKKMGNNTIILNVDNFDKVELFYDKTILHFAGAPGRHTHKLINMTRFSNKIKNITIENNIQLAKSFIDEHLLPIIKDSGELLEGNIFMFHHTTNYTDRFINKAKNISNMVLNQQIKNVLEIGFNAGFSTLLMLLSNPYVKLTCSDLCEHAYTIPCYLKLKEIFGDRIHLKPGDSTNTLPTLSDTYDLIHIDGGHDDVVATSDIINSYHLSKNRTILIMDDYDFPNLHKLWDSYIAKYNLQKLDIYVYDSPHHDIKFVVK